MILVTLNWNRCSDNIFIVFSLQLLILSYLDATSLLRMSEVCTHFHSIATDALLWRQLVLRDFGGRADDSNANWREVC